MRQDNAVREISAEYLVAADDVPVGYKKTEVGVIPEEWEVHRLESTSSFVGSGKTPTKNRGDYPLYGSTGQIGTCSHAQYEGESILVARVGANAGALNFVAGRYGVSDNTIIVKIRGADIAFIKYQLVRANLNNLVFGSGQPLITGSQLKQLAFPSPKIKEQTAIATALSDVDALITSLEKLIAKKQSIKTATMQQLLTGKTRLPQFALREDGAPKGFKQSELGEVPEDWESSTIGANTTWSSGGTPNRNNAAYWKGKIPWISGSTLKQLEISTSDQFVTSAGVAAGSNMAPLNSTLLLVRGSALHNEIRAGLVVAPVCFNQDVKALVPNSLTHPKYLPIYILGMGDELLKLVSSAGNSAGVLDTELVKNFGFPRPSLNEQIAISETLSDMDTEIQTLQQRLHKTRQIKQGMMQELLTGKTRLIKPQEAVA